MYLTFIVMPFVVIAAQLAGNLRRWNVRFFRVNAGRPGDKVSGQWIGQHRILHFFCIGRKQSVALFRSAFMRSWSMTQLVSSFCM